MKQTEHKLWPLYPTIGHFRAHRGGLHTLTLATLKVTRFIFFFFFILRLFAQDPRLPTTLTNCVSVYTKRRKTKKKKSASRLSQLIRLQLAVI